MNSEWTISRPTRRCCMSGREFREGEIYYTALFETETGLERRDYAAECWTGAPSGSFCHFKTRLAAREKPKATVVVDHQLLVQLFQQLEERTSTFSRQFRFVLALLLMRKRLLRLEGSERREGEEYWRLRLTVDQSGHEVLNPRLGEEEVRRLSDQLLAVLGGDLEAIAGVDGGDGPATPAPAEPAVPVETSDAVVNNPSAGG